MNLIRNKFLKFYSIHCKRWQTTKILKLKILKYFEFFFKNYEKFVKNKKILK